MVQGKDRKVSRRERPQSAQKTKLSRQDYEAKMAELHVELVKLQFWAKHTGARIIVIFEGRDAAGKGGVIKRITERVSPRVFRVVALPAPSERERTQIYFQRYFEHLPAGGEIVIFDRSWYNRAGVERVMGFCTDDQYHRFLRLCPAWEKDIIDAGVTLIKYWFEVSKEEQTRRFQERIIDGRKTWKLSPMDMESHRRWYDYSRARDAMFAATDTRISPWYVVDADDKQRARLNCIAHFLSLIPYEETECPKIDLPPRQEAKGYREPDYPYNRVPDKY
ncbi:Polyphosphate:ADP phosphotransferase 3 [Paraburkholderia ultramafica]|uniref:ADP/GDP-polyphosphate phosphotransferase n=1 Tax=Paraburkholderia ultramafica TaxID=1544867 RepID=A0A6S7B9B5_9BURK|nr:polyphosphate kinase 2 [Paraburkholderia ultramafica]CAB3792247.1 Polyphosphate:ADP phosphotransferase 3 [Paraburkholderia ultramafica]